MRLSKPVIGHAKAEHRWTANTSKAASATAPSPRPATTSACSCGGLQNSRRRSPKLSRFKTSVKSSVARVLQGRPNRSPIRPRASKPFSRQRPWATSRVPRARSSQWNLLLCIFNLSLPFSAPIINKKIDLAINTLNQVPTSSMIGALRKPARNWFVQKQKSSMSYHGTKLGLAAW